MSSDHVPAWLSNESILPRAVACRFLGQLRRLNDLYISPEALADLLNWDKEHGQEEQTETTPKDIASDGPGVGDAGGGGEAVCAGELGGLPHRGGVSGKPP